MSRTLCPTGDVEAMNEVTTNPRIHAAVSHRDGDVVVEPCDKKLDRWISVEAPKLRQLARRDALAGEEGGVAGCAGISIHVHANHETEPSVERRGLCLPSRVARSRDRPVGGVEWVNLLFQAGSVRRREKSLG